MGKVNQCDICAYYEYNEDTEMYECMLNLDQDEIEHFYNAKRNDCPYFHLGDEYAVVRKQN